MNARVPVGEGQLVVGCCWLQMVSVCQVVLCKDRKRGKLGSVRNLMPVVSRKRSNNNNEFLSYLELGVGRKKHRGGEGWKRERRTHKTVEVQITINPSFPHFAFFLSSFSVHSSTSAPLSFKFMIFFFNYYSISLSHTHIHTERKRDL